MSQFLAPIHSWLFNKIKINEGLELEVLSLLDNDKKGSLKEIAVNKFGNYTKDVPLEDQIELSNIHGWLQNSITSSESRLAFILKNLMDFGISIESIEKSFYNYGVEISNSRKLENLDSKDIYKYINDTLLDGMPCDMVNSLVSENEDSFTYIQNKDIHIANSNNGGLDPVLFNNFRDCFIKGLLSTLNYKIEVTNESPRTYCATKINI